MSLATVVGQSPQAASLPAVVVTVIQEQLDVFTRLQQTRYVEEGINLTEEQAGAEVTAEVMRTKPFPSARPLTAPNTRAAVAEAYRLSASALGDYSVGALWGLCNEVLQVHEGDLAEYANASTMIRRWYNTYFVDMPYVDEKIAEARLLNVPSCQEDALYDIGKFLLDAVERTFFAGAFTKMAEVMDVLVGLLRRAAVNPLPADVESALADVKRLMYASYDHAEGSHQAWQRDANEQTYEAKRIFQDFAARPDTSACEAIAHEYCHLCLDILLMVSGDASLIRERCLNAKFSLFDYLTGVCAVTNPTMLLHEVHRALCDAVSDFSQSDADGAWTYTLAEAILAAGCMEDLVVAMKVAGELAEQLPWSPAALASSVVTSTQDWERDESDDDDTDEPLTEADLMPMLKAGAKNPSLRHFVLLCMAAHMADLCAPPVVAPCAVVDLTLERNNLVMQYLELFASDSQTWRIAGVYAAYSPLINPVVLYNLCMYAARLAAADDQVYTRLNHLFHHLWSSSSAHQTILQAKAKATMPASATLLAWIEANEYVRQKAYKDAHRYIVATRFHQGDYAGAVWLAVESQVAQGIQWRIKTLLLSKDALQSQPVLRIGEGVHNSFIALDACPTVALAASLRVCAAIAAYARAAAASSAMQRTPVNDTRHAPLVLRTLTWTVQTIVDALESMDVCDFFVHPVTTFTLVEHGADIIVLLRRWTRLLQPHTPDSISAALSSTVLPILHQSFELTQVHHRHMDLKSRAVRIREKLVRTCDSHLDA